jgi:hypothetical protein
MGHLKMLVDQGAEDAPFLFFSHSLHHLAEFPFDVFLVFIYYLRFLDVDSWFLSFCLIGQPFATILFEVAQFLAVEASMLLLFFFGWFHHVNIHTIFRVNMVPLFVEEFEKVGLQLC